MFEYEVKMPALKIYEPKRDGPAQLSSMSITPLTKAMQAIVLEITEYHPRLKNDRRTSHATDYARNIVA